MVFAVVVVVVAVVVILCDSNCDFGGGCFTWFLFVIAIPAVVEIIVLGGGCI
jgi:hypothetical protein